MRCAALIVVTRREQGAFGPVLVRLCGPCTSGERGVIRLGPGLAHALAHGRNFVTLITDRYQNGIVRGQLLVR